MKEKFTKQRHQNFINYFNIKPTPNPSLVRSGSIEEDFIKKTVKYVKFIKWIPGLRMVGIGNSVSMNCATIDSDIDLFIVTTNNSMWLNRILITLIFTILGVRKTDKKHAGMFCLSFFCTLEGLDFSSWKLENDIYLYYWILYFKPILNVDNTYELFLEKNGIKNKKSIPSPFYSEVLSLKKEEIKELQNNNKFIGFLDKIIKKVFLQKTIRHYNSIGKPYGVIINDDMLKFHNNDVREKIKEELVLKN